MAIPWADVYHHVGGMMLLPLDHDSCFDSVAPLAGTLEMDNYHLFAATGDDNLVYLFSLFLVAEQTNAVPLYEVA